jgi:hypothetical protein
MLRQKGEMAALKDDHQVFEEYNELMGFKKAMQAKDDVNTTNLRPIKRKGSQPKANARDFEAENANFGVKNEVDLVLQRIAGQKQYGEKDFNKAKGMYNRQTLNYSADEKGQHNNKKAEKYLTVQSLLDHPYFLNINNADISSVIDQYEALLAGKGHMPEF